MQLRWLELWRGAILISYCCHQYSGCTLVVLEVIDTSRAVCQTHPESWIRPMGGKRILLGIMLIDNCYIRMWLFLLDNLDYLHCRFCREMVCSAFLIRLLPAFSYEANSVLAGPLVWVKHSTSTQNEISNQLCFREREKKREKKTLLVE